MDSFYINCALKDDHLLLTHIENGVREFEAIRYKPHVFVPYDKKSKYKDIFGRPLRRIDFDSIKKSKFFIYGEKEKPGGGQTVYGNFNWNYVFLTEKYPQKPEFDLPQLTEYINILIIDIEVGTVGGFSTPEEALQKVTAITMKVVGPAKRGQKNVIVFGLEDSDITTAYNNTRDDVDYRPFDNEKEMLLAFIDEWEEIGPDIVTGWYIEFFDIPYLVNRICRIMDLKTAERMSVWDQIVKRKSLSSERHGQEIYDILGVSTLDYRSLYMKFSLKGQESYSLNHISHVELQEKKLSYDEYGNLDVLRSQNYQKFIDYNIRDVELVEMLDKKLKFILMVALLAYDSRVNYYDVFAQTRMWDTIIYKYLYDQGIVYPPRPDKPGDAHIKGAFVKEPAPGLYNWVTSFDLDSMYPSLMIQYNISPETLVNSPGVLFDIDKVLAERPDLSYLHEQNITLGQAGFHFRRDKTGFLPAILKTMYMERVAYKAQAAEYKANVSIIDEILEDRGYKAK